MPRANPMQVGDNPLAGVAEMFGKLGEAAQQRQDEAGRAWAIEAVSNARLEWTSHLQERQANAELGAPDFTGKFITDFDAYADEAVKAAPSEAAGKFFRERLLDIRTSLGEKAITFEAAARVDYRDTKFNNAIDAGQKVVSVDPSQFEVVLAEQLAVVDSSALPPKARADMRQKVISSIAGASVWSQIRSNPSAFLEQIGYAADNKQGVIGKTGNKAFDILPFETRNKMVADAISEINKINTEAERATERQRKEKADEFMKEAIARANPQSGSPRLDRNFVEQARPFVTPAQYESLIKMMKGDGEGGTDPEAFAALQRLVYSDPEAAVQQAFVYHRNGAINNGTLSSVLSRAHELGRQGGPKSEYERTRQRITGNLDPGPFVQDPAGRTRMAEALYEFDAWMEGGKRSETEVAEKGREIIAKYSLWDKTKVMPPKVDTKKPTSPREKALAPIGQEWDKVKKDYAAKRISKQEYDRRALELKARWKQIEEQYKDQ